MQRKVQNKRVAIIVHKSILQGGEGVNAGVGEVEWVVAKDRYKYDQTFDSLNPIDGKITGAGKYNMIYTFGLGIDFSTPLRVQRKSEF